MTVRVYLGEGAVLPEYQTEGSSGVDLRSTVDVEIEPMRAVLIPTGIHVELPEGFEAQVRTRSGLALKNSVIVLNSPGTVDSDYRGEVKVILFNLSDESFVVHKGDRVAQLVVCRYEKVKFEAVPCKEVLSDTSRGSGGFGHSGRK